MLEVNDTIARSPHGCSKKKESNLGLATVLYELPTTMLCGIVFDPSHRDHLATVLRSRGHSVQHRQKAAMQFVAFTLVDAMTGAFHRY